MLQRDFEGHYESIPPHGRWQHFEVGDCPRVTQLLQSWPSSVDTQERCRRLIDLFLVSVLLDAGAGTKWSYKSKKSGKSFSRSEGLAVASLEMFKAGLFSSNAEQPDQVDAAGLKKMTVETLAKAMQVSETNPMSGLEGRAGLLIRLSKALQNQETFGSDGRPGNMIGEYLAKYMVLMLMSKITYWLIPPRRHQPYLLLHSQHYGPFSWMVCRASGQPQELRSREFRLAMPGRALQCHCPALGNHGKISYHSTSLHSGSAIH